MRLLRWRTIGLLVALIGIVLAVGGTARQFSRSSRREHLSRRLAEAVEQRQELKEIRRLLRQGADPSYEHRGGEPVLVTALEHPDEGVPALLLAAGARLDVDSRDGQTPLVVAIRTRRTELARRLLARGASPDLTFDGYTPLMHAAGTGNEELVRLLIDRGAAVSSRGPDQVTALHMAALNGQSGALRRLLTHGALVDAPAAGGVTPLMWAGSVETVRALVAAGASVRRKTASGDTPLHHAATGCVPESIPVLLAHGADPTARNRNGQTPLDAARAELFVMLRHQKGRDLTATERRQALHRLEAWAAADIAQPGAPRGLAWAAQAVLLLRQP